MKGLYVIANNISIFPGKSNYFSNISLFRVSYEALTLIHCDVNTISGGER